MAIQTPVTMTVNGTTTSNNTVRVVTATYSTAGMTPGADGFIWLHLRITMSPWTGTRITSWLFDPDLGEVAATAAAGSGVLPTDGGLHLFPVSPNKSAFLSVEIGDFTAGDSGTVTLG